MEHPDGPKVNSYQHTVWGPRKLHLEPAQKLHAVTQRSWLLVVNGTRAFRTESLDVESMKEVGSPSSCCLSTCPESFGLQAHLTPSVSGHGFPTLSCLVTSSKSFLCSQFLGWSPSRNLPGPQEECVRLYPCIFPQRCHIPKATVTKQHRKLFARSFGD